MKNYKVGDWCFHDYKLSQIKRMKGCKIQEITTGYISCSSNELSVFPLTIENKLASEYVGDIRTKLGLINGLNMPDVNRRLVYLWGRLCESKDKESDYNKINKFYDDIKKASDNSRLITIDGVDIFR